MSMQQTADLILSIDLAEDRNTWDHAVRGRFDAAVVSYDTAAGYDSTPTTHVSACESVWAGFQMNAYYGHPEINDGRAYGFEYGYKPEYGLIQSRQIERYSKGLRKVEKAYDKLCTDYGRPQSLGQDVVYVMRAIGVTRACWKLPNGRPGGQYRDWRVVHDDMEAVRYHIDSAIDALRAKQLEAAIEGAA